MNSLTSSPRAAYPRVITPGTSMNSKLFAVAIVALTSLYLPGFVVPATGQGATSATGPHGVSPGSPTVATRAAGSCPTFSWSGSETAVGYDLALYRVDAGGATTKMLTTRVSGDARGWTPSAAECPPSGATYAWSVRALTDEESGPWSEWLLFQTAGLPSDDEVRQAMQVLRRFQQGRREAGIDSTTTEHARETSVEDSEPGVPIARHLTALTTPTLEPAPQIITAPSNFSLALDGDIDLAGAIFKGQVPFIHEDGGPNFRNTAIGRGALRSLTPGTPDSFSGSDNSAFGFLALANTSNGLRNTGVGNQALVQNSEGILNTGVGHLALAGNTVGGGNTAVGAHAMQGNKGGSWNTAIGYQAGNNWQSGSHNIAIGWGAFGADHLESGVIRIGGDDQQTQTFIEGIRDSPLLSAEQVFITSGDKLGVAVSSARFKQNIRDLAGVSERLLSLRPVSFRYDEELAGGPTPQEYGLIAEEVAKVFPDLVLNDEDGKPLTVRYHLLTPLLLGEIQRQDQELIRLSGLDEQVAALRRAMADRDRLVADLRRRLDKLAKKKRFRD